MTAPSIFSPSSMLDTERLFPTDYSANASSGQASITPYLPVSTFTNQTRHHKRKLFVQGRPSDWPREVVRTSQGPQYFLLDPRCISAPLFCFCSVFPFFPLYIPPLPGQQGWGGGADQAAVATATMAASAAGPSGGGVAGRLTRSASLPQLRIHAS